MAQKRTVTWPVTVSVPQDGGQTQDEKFDVEFEVLTQDELDAVVREGEDLLMRCVNGWPHGPKSEEEGRRVPFSPEAKKALLNITYARHALFGAYGEVQQGRAAARKNV